MASSFRPAPRFEYDGVEFFLDGDSIGQAVEEGHVDSNDWRLDFDTSGETLGAHVLSAVSRNGTLESVPADINVTFTDDINPVVSAYSPANDADVSGSFTFTVTATDNVAATGASWSLDGDHYASMAPQGGGVFTATVNVSALPNGLTFLYTEVSDAEGNQTPGNIGINVLNPQAPTLSTGEVEYYGSTQVGSEGMNAFGATATGHPTPTVSYSWRVCNTTPSCNNYAGDSYNPIAADVGRTVELVVRASNGVNPQDTEIIAVGTVTAADVIEPEPTPTPAPAPPPPPPPAPAPAPAPVTPKPAPVIPPAAKPPVTTIVKTGSDPQKVPGTAGPDRIVTGSGYDVIRAGAGNDVISPGKGGGLVVAGTGNDIVKALQSKNLVVNCGTGKDKLFANKSTKSVGCEQVIVASNSKLVSVKVGADTLPVMPPNFISPNAPTQKSAAVVEAEKKAAVVAAAVDEQKKQAAIADAKAALAAKAVVDAKVKADAAAKAEAAAAAKVKADSAAAAAKKAALAQAIHDEQSKLQIEAANGSLLPPKPLSRIQGLLPQQQRRRATRPTRRPLKAQLTTPQRLRRSRSWPRRRSLSLKPRWWQRRSLSKPRPRWSLLSTRLSRRRKSRSPRSRRPSRRSRPISSRPTAPRKRLCRPVSSPNWRRRKQRS